MSDLVVTTSGASRYLQKTVIARSIILSYQIIVKQHYLYAKMSLIKQSVHTALESNVRGGASRE